MNEIIFAQFGKNSNIQKEHSHKVWEVILCASRGELQTAKGNFPYRRGELLVIPPLLPHQISGQITGSIFIHLDRALLPFKGVRVLQPNPYLGLQNAMLEAVQIYEQQKPAILTALGSLIVSYLVDCSGTKFSPIVAQVLSEIDRNLSDCAYALEDTLHALPLNYDYIRKLFKKEVGCTPLDYLIQRRMALAKEILQSQVTNTYSNYSISQVAESCGFSDPLYFSRVFKKTYGVPPSEFH